ncbi:MAG: (2Fe-2S)-binding protein [Planctomycetales bacterium]|nr:(2Fe-2S)-binding protein [Planctomycetales bacterium]
MSQHTIEVTVNGEKFERTVESRTLLIDFLREDLGLTGTHAGCEHGVCGACTIQLDGEAIRSCTMLAVQANGHSIRTVEALSEGGRLSRLQQSLKDHHGLQCGFCTSGLLMTLDYALREHSKLDLTDESEVRALISGNLCRCTGYQNIVNAVMSLADGNNFEGE